MASDRAVAFDDLEVGRELGTTQFLVDAVDVEAYERTTGLTAPVRLDAAGRREVSPTFAAVYTRGVRELLVAPPGGIHAEQEYDFVRSVHVGDRLTTSTRVVDKYVKRERRCVVVESTTVNFDGDVVSVARATRIWAR